MKINIKSIMVLVCVLFLTLYIGGCTEKESTNLYANKKCIICGSSASESIMAPKGYLATLNTDYSSENYEESSHSAVITIFYCNNCYYDLADKTVKGIY